jgi:CPA2 family monovalent cation:H+ antiporter-2
MTLGVSLAQIGEFSFILAGMGLHFQVLPQEAYHLILAGALVSIAFNMFAFRTINPLIAWASEHYPLVRHWDLRPDPLAALPLSTDSQFLSNQVVVVGYGRVGKKLVIALKKHGVAVVVVDDNRENIEELRKNGQPAVLGDACEAVTLVQAHIANATLCVVALKNSTGMKQLVSVARTLNPAIQFIVRASSAEEAVFYEQEGYGQVFNAEVELAKNLSHAVFQRLAPAQPQSD